MGYACPVCGDPQADGEHLANHLAFTAMLGDADHEDWLDDHVPDWGETDPPELADRVADHAEEREFPQVFEDTTTDHDHGPDGHAHDHGHGQDGHAHGRGGHAHGGGGAGGLPEGVAPGGVADPADLFDEREDERSESSSGASGATASDDERDPADVLAEARELTEQRRASAGEDASESDGDDADAADGGDATETDDG